MPLVTLLLKLKKGKANIYVMELIHGVDYEKLADIFNLILPLPQRHCLKWKSETY